MKMEWKELEAISTIFLRYPHDVYIKTAPSIGEFSWKEVFENVSYIFLKPYT
jgi:hypothetical protein